jgi:uncharacterized protein
MTTSNTSPFHILNNAMPQTQQGACCEDEIELLADGSESHNGVVKLQVMGKEIWFDIKNQAVLQWGESGNPESIALPTAEGESTGCSGCSYHEPNRETTDKIRKLRQSGVQQRYETCERAETIQWIELHVNDKCNFRCNYCYLKSAGIEYLDNEMPREVARKAIDFLVASTPEGEGGVIKFYGGEPFLSYGLMKYVVDYSQQEGRKKNQKIVYTVNTNGTLLNEEKIQWCQDNNVRVTISLDGNEASNDKHRVYTSGNGTYKVVMKKALKFLEQAGYLNLRSTINDGTFELKNSMLEFSQIGDPKKIQYQVDFNLVGENHVTTEDADKLMGEQEEIALAFVEKLKAGEKMNYSNLMEPMFKAFYSVKTPYHCGAARTVVSVSPKGKMYPCHRFIDVHATEMGDVDNGLNGTQLEEWKRNRVEFKKPCSSCWARNFCGGGCGFNNYFTHGNIEDPNNIHCKMFRHQVKLGMYLFTEVQNMENQRTGQLPSSQPQEALAK